MVSYCAVERTSAVSTLNSCVFVAMHIAWRERNKDARIKAAKDILEKNPEFV